MASSNKKNKKKKKEKRSFSLLLLLIFLIILLLILLPFAYRIPQAQPQEAQPAPAKSSLPESSLPAENFTSIIMKVPAVDSEGKGVITLLTIQARKGKGRTLVDIDNILFWADTQQSIRVAKFVAANFTKLNINEYDIVYNIEANASLIGGPSAGAALTIGTIAALQNKKLNESVMITGVINHDGTIGPVSQILEKARAAKKEGAKLFLVPLLQSRDVVYETSEHCEKWGWTKICTVEQIPRKISVEEEAGIAVMEISSIEEAIKYFLI